MCLLKVAHSTLKALIAVKGISDMKATKLKEAAAKVVPMGFLTVSSVTTCRWLSVFPRQAKEYQVTRSDMVSLTTGSSDLDDLLGGTVGHTRTVSTGYSPYVVYQAGSKPGASPRCLVNSGRAKRRSATHCA